MQISISYLIFGGKISIMKLSSSKRSPLINILINLVQVYRRVLFENILLKTKNI